MEPPYDALLTLGNLRIPYYIRILYGVIRDLTNDHLKRFDIGTERKSFRRKINNITKITGPTREDSEV
jgi:hypothetical protein